MIIRRSLVALILLFDLLVMPAVARLPGYLSRGVSLAALQSWKSEWVLQPRHSAQTLLLPEGEADHAARNAWGLLQFLLAIPVITFLWPGDQWRVNRKGTPEHDRSGTYGTARWRSSGELDDTLQSVKFRSGAPPAGLLAGVDREARPDLAWLVPGPVGPAKTNPHVLVLGGSGSGKTRRLVFPNLWLLGQAKLGGAPNSVIVTDPKGELYSYTSDYFRDLGYRVYTLNLIDPKRSDMYNPLSEVTAILEGGDTSAAAQAVLDIAHAFAAMDQEKGGREDPFWQNAAESIIAACMYRVAEVAPKEQKNMASVYRMLIEFGKNDGARLDLEFQSIPDLMNPARTFYGVTQLAVEKTRANILTTAAVNLRLFSDPSVAAMTAGTGYPLDAVGRESSVVYLLLPDDKSSRNAVATSYLIQLYSSLTRLALMSEKGRLPVPVFWLLDEFANIGKFKDFDKMISVMRGRGMAAMIILQALQQLEARYGKETASVITANCDTWLFLRTNDRDTAKELSEKMGQYTARTAVGNASYRRHDMTTGMNEQLIGRALMTPDEILRWPMGQVLAMQAGQFPSKLSLADISQWPASFRESGPPPERRDVASVSDWLPE